MSESKIDLKKYLFLIGIVVLVAGCTQELDKYRVKSKVETYSTDYVLDVLVTDSLSLGRSVLFSNEMTRLTLNLINLADVEFRNVTGVLINAEELSPVAETDYADIIVPNDSIKFRWDLTAPKVGLGESLIIKNMKVRVYYETYAEGWKDILLKAYSDVDKSYVSTDSYKSGSPVVVFFDTSYETVNTFEDGVRNFTVNMVYFNNYSGLVDYYDNSDIEDNYLRRIVLSIDKINKGNNTYESLIFYNALDEDSPWQKVDENSPDELLDELGIDRDSLAIKDYYYIKYTSFEQLDIDPCSYEEAEDEEQIEEQRALMNMITQQRRVLWMTTGYKKVNVLRFGAPSLDSDTVVKISARIDYSYSQDYGGNDFGVIVYGTQ